MFGCGSKYFSGHLKLRHVHRYALRIANELHKSNAKCSTKKKNNSVNVSPADMSLSKS